MKVFLAGATGAIGQPLVRQLLAAGHQVVGTTRSETRAAELRARGADAVVLDAFDAARVREAILDARPEVVVHQLTALPRDVSPKAMRAAAEVTTRLRRDTVPVFVDAAREAGARRIVVQSISFVTRPDGPAILDEDAPLWLDTGERGWRAQLETLRAMEAGVVGADGIEGLVLRYGWFYGPGTWYEREGTIGRMIAARRHPVIGSGKGLGGFVHVDDAAAATVLALDRGAPGVYNITDDDPVPAATWVREVAGLLGAKPPRRVPAWLARRVAGPLLVHYQTTLRGASNARAKAAFGWQPRPRAEGFAQVFGPPRHDRREALASAA